MNLAGMKAGFWRNLTRQESREYTNFLARQVQWLMYLEQCRKNKTPIDYSKGIPDEDYFRAQKIRDKFFDDYKGKGSINDWALGY